MINTQDIRASASSSQAIVISLLWEHPKPSLAVILIIWYNIVWFGAKDCKDENKYRPSSIIRMVEGPGLGSRQHQDLEPYESSK